MVARDHCWFRGCTRPGEPRPLFAYGHDLPAILRLCQTHMSAVADSGELVATHLVRPTIDPGALRSGQAAARAACRSRLTPGSSG